MESLVSRFHRMKYNFTYMVFKYVIIVFNSNFSEVYISGPVIYQHIGL